MVLGSQKPFDTAFKQQRLKAWQPLLTPKNIIMTFSTVGILFLAVGIVISVADKSVVEFEAIYPDTCKIGDTCTITMKIDREMQTPIYFYYKIAGMYQNHRRYVKSRDDDQLAGKFDTKGFKSCDPLIKNGDKVIYPCGLIAASFFTDVITASVNGVQLEGDAWNKTNIIWTSDRDKFKSNPQVYGTPDYSHYSILDGQQVQMPQVTDEDFIIWMRTAALPTFKKLYRIKTDKQSIPEGSNLVISIQNNYDVSKFGAVKSIVVSTTSFMGGKNPFLGWAYITVSIFSLLFAGAMSAKLILSPRKQGDLSYWEKNHAN